jgi:hypothetical protein
MMPVEKRELACGLAAGNGRLNNSQVLELSKGYDVAIDDGGFGRLPGAIDKNFEIARVDQVVLLHVTPVGRFDLRHQPVYVADPPKSLRLNGKPEAGISQERPAQLF